MNPISVVIADDHAVVRSGIRTLLKGAEDIVVVGEAETGTEALRAVGKLGPDVLLLDINLPDISGTDVARRLAAASTKVQVLVLSAFFDEEDIEDMLDTGVAGYLLKNEAPGRIVEAVRGVARGEDCHFSRPVTAKVMRSRRRFPARIPNDCKALSQRERQIAELVARGLDQSEIAKELGLERGTVKNHLTKLYEKSGTRTMQKLMVWGQQQGYGSKRT